METKNKSEKLFEQYLDQNGFEGKWEYEPAFEEKSKKSDYLLSWKENKFFFEVKQLEKKKNDSNVLFDIYKSLRGKIDEARKKFKEYKEFSCSLVVFNFGDSSAVLKPDIILEAMLGSLGIAADFDTEKGGMVAGSERNVFTNGGKMINHMRTQNTTISAIIVLEEFRDNTEIKKAMKNEIEKHGKPFEGLEQIDVIRKLHQIHHVESVPRLVVVENPFAQIAFPEDLFMSPFDERWCWEKESGKVRRIFVGSKLKEPEILKNEVSSKLNDGKAKC